MLYYYIIKIWILWKGKKGIRYNCHIWRSYLCKCYFKERNYKI